MSIDLNTISLAGVGLEPTPGAAKPEAGPLDGKAKFLVESRGNKVDRRKNIDRRAEIRFEPNRRRDTDRRPSSATWHEKKNV